jgi:hypothetical protein
VLIQRDQTGRSPEHARNPSWREFLHGPAFTSQGNGLNFVTTGDKAPADGYRLAHRGKRAQSGNGPATRRPLPCGLVPVTGDTA